MMKKSKILTYVVVLLIGILWVLPFMGVLMASVRPYGEIVDGWWHFDKFSLTTKNFEDAWNHPYAPLKVGILNSLSIAGPCTLLTIITGSLAGYAFMRFKFRFKNSLLILLILFMAIPAQSIIIPLSLYMGKLGLTDTRMGLILLHTAIAQTWCVFFMRNFFISIPTDLIDSARVDGASEFTTFRRIVLPIARPAVLSVAVLSFVWVWSEFFYALVLLPSTENWVLTQMVPAMVEPDWINWSLISAASVITMIIPLLIFFLLQKYYIRGILSGAVKG